MGANIYPEDIEQGLFAESEDARRLGTFCLELLDLGDGEQHVCIHITTRGESATYPEWLIGARRTCRQPVPHETIAAMRDETVRWKCAFHVVTDAMDRLMR